MWVSCSKLTKSKALKRIPWTSLRPFLHKGLGWSTGLVHTVYVFTVSYITPTCSCVLYEQLKLTLLWWKLVSKGTHNPYTINKQDKEDGFGSACRVGSLTTTSEKGRWCLGERTICWQHHAEREGHFMPWQGKLGLTMLNMQVHPVCLPEFTPSTSKLWNTHLIVIAGHPTPWGLPGKYRPYLKSALPRFPAPHGCLSRWLIPHEIMLTSIILTFVSITEE